MDAADNSNWFYSPRTLEGWRNGRWTFLAPFALAPTFVLLKVVVVVAARGLGPKSNFDSASWEMGTTTYKCTYMYVARLDVGTANMCPNLGQWEQTAHLPFRG
jgi:hypothetical protein